jgi:spoIIIJ-associated protein
MSRRIDAHGSTLEEALREAVADLADLDPEKVELRLRAAGLDEFEGQVRFDLEIGGADATEEPAEAPEAVEDDVEDEVEDEDEDQDDARETAEDRDDAPESEDGADGGLRAEDLDEEADAAADFLEGLLDAMDLPGDLRIRVHEDHAEVEVVEIGSGALIGRRGQTLEAIQELVRCALQREFQRRSRVKVDAEGYRARRLEKLLEKAEEAIEEVLDGGEGERLEPMDVFERKAIHHLVAQYDGVSSRSQGREPARRVIIERD